YPAQTPEGGFTMPEGVGLPYTAGEVLVFQVHYLNSTASALHPEIYVHLDTQTTPVQENAGVLFFYDPFIYVPQGGMGIASTRCPIPSNITLFTQSSHYHARGWNYQAVLDTPASDAGSPTVQGATPFYTSNNWESPTQGSATIPIAAGSDIRFYCYYNNEQGTQNYIQGQSALTNEMCMFVGLYYPAMSVLDEQCQNGDMFGTGTTSCQDTLSCLNACPPDDGDDAGQLATYDECTQKCFVTGCPESADAIINVSNCMQTSCATECASMGASCDSCVQSQCASEYQACTNATCGAVPAPPQ
ncbi:MAG TPA: hypothetical protein VK745_01465, partial [Polyangiaceae bacterium]|nr:hypothetical protein [Polyangiaceae bacterium]